ncbi:hypothetical protein PSPO01_03026 [Paraphaeosphaeria sporulosa]
MWSSNVNLVRDFKKIGGADVVGVFRRLTCGLFSVGMPCPSKALLVSVCLDSNPSSLCMISSHPPPFLVQREQSSQYVTVTGSVLARQHRRGIQSGALSPRYFISQPEGFSWCACVRRPHGTTRHEGRCGAALCTYVVGQAGIDVVRHTSM